MNKLVNTLVILGVISFGTLPAQAVSVNDQVKTQKDTQFETKEQIKEATSGNWCPPGYPYC
jgi:mannose/fructose/N-acetylgalactosamine-specific phosphotransferase system component IID